MHNPILAQYLGMLVAKAAAESDPILYAEMVLDNLSDEHLGELLALQPTPVDAFVALVPQVEQYRPWFTELVKAVRDAMDADANNAAQYGGLAPAPQHHASDSQATDILGGTPPG